MTEPPGAAAPKPPRLTPREMDCLRGVRALKSSDEIARDLGIASGTVDSYIRDAITKLGARDRRDAAKLFAVIDRDAPNLSGGESLGMETTPAIPPGIAQPDAGREEFELHDSASEQWRFAEPPHAQSGFRMLVREVLDGTRPDDLTMVKRAWLTLAAAVAIGFCFFAIAAGAGMLFGIASFLRWLAT